MSHIEIRPGDRIALLAPGSEDYVRLVVTFLAAGIVPVPLDPRLTEYELKGILDDVSPRLVVDGHEQVTEMLANAPEHTRLGLPLARPMHMTSGTTGTPKGVWSGILAEDAARALVAEERDLWGFTGIDVHMVLSPLYHSAPLRFAMGTLLAGGRIVVPGPFDAAATTEAITAHRPTTMFCVPAHLQRLFSHWDEVGVPDLSSFRLVAHAGAACPPPVKQRLLELFPDGTTWEFYGSTEGQFTACRSEEWLRHRGTVGRARPGRTITVDDDGTLWCVVPEHARFTYWNAPEKTAASWRETPLGPAFSVGDLGRIDEDGYVYLDGRRDDLIISGGVNVYPVEVEHVLGEHPGVD
ncbi:MAG: class I adenylate-forming enzyme family protein, partial [Nocardioidaceae bacterium]